MVLYIKLENALLPHLFVSNVTNKAIFPDYVNLLPYINPVLIGIQGDHGMVEVEAATEMEKVEDPNVLYTKQKLQTLQNP